MSEFHEKINVVLAEFSIDTPIYELKLKTKNEYIEYVTHKFTYLDETSANIFACNSATISIFKDLFLTAKALKMLLNYEGAIQDGWMILSSLASL